MKCERIRESLPAYLEGALGWLARRRVERHLSECEACRRESHALRRTVDLLRAAGEERIPCDVTAAVMARLPVEESRVGVMRRARPVVLVPAALAAAAALVVQLSVNAPSHERASVEAPRAVYLQEYAQFRASQEIGDSTGIFLLASELARDAQ